MSRQTRNMTRAHYLEENQTVTRTSLADRRTRLNSTRTETQGARIQGIAQRALVYWKLTNCFVTLAIDRGNYGFSGEAAVPLRLGPCLLDRPPAFFANTVEYHRRESLHHKVGFARVQGRGNRSSA